MQKSDLIQCHIGCVIPVTPMVRRASSRNPALALCLHICHVRPPVLGPAVLNIALRHLCRRLGERARPNGNASRSKKVFELFMAKRPRKGRTNARANSAFRRVVDRGVGNSSPLHFFISARDYGDLSVMRRLPHPTLSRRCLFERGYHLEVPS